MLPFDWDDENSAHIATHGVSCAEAEQVISNEPFDVELQTVKDEERFVQLGETNAGRIMVCLLYTSLSHLVEPVVVTAGKRSAVWSHLPEPAVAIPGNCFAVCSDKSGRQR